MSKAYLILEDGSVFEGEGFGAEASSVGELVFTTGVVGYIETLTDPSYYGQIIMQTFPLIGNYGVIAADFEGDCCAKGYVVREWCDTPSNFRSEMDVDAFLKAKGVPGICGLDTRELTKILREKGVMNAMITRELPGDIEAVKAYAVRDAVASVTTGETEFFPAEGEAKYKVIMLDFGAKADIHRELQKRGCDVKIVPASTPAEVILAENPDGIMLSNGPGDPAENTACIAEIKKLLGKAPIFGVCLGHQLTALAAGGETVKLKYGHRGANQPCKDLKTGRTYITTQNHGYAVVADSVKCGVQRWINANDNTCEGMDYPEYRAFTVQFHPEACAGPRDTAFLFDRFIELMGGADRAAE